MLKTTGNLFRKNSWAGLTFSTLATALLTLPASASIIGGDLNSIIGGDAQFIANQEFIAIGPVESIDRRKNVVVVLGQSFSIDSMTLITVSETSSASQGPKILKLIRRGDYVAVGGWQTTARTVTASRITVLPSTYVDGSSSTYVKGRIGAIDFALGRLTVGSLQVDYTASLGSMGANQLAVGRTVELVGMRPTPGGAMLAFTAKAEEPQSIIGGDVNSIIGGDANSIIGGDINSIIGGDANSIIGGDTNSIIGGDANSIISGDTNSIIGGDTNSIIGGDTNSIIGGDAINIICGNS